MNNSTLEVDTFKVVLLLVSLRLFTNLAHAKSPLHDVETIISRQFI